MLAYQNDGQSEGKRYFVHKSDLPARCCVWQYLGIVIVDRERAQTCDHRRTALVPLRHLSTEFGKIRVAFPHSDGVAKVAIAEDHEVLGVLAVFFGLEFRRANGSNSMVEQLFRVRTRNMYLVR